ncbi:MAG: dihydrofolate reductase family protein [Geminicoccaceae bacterium]
MTNPRVSTQLTAIAFRGYAVVSADGFIADSHGHMPDALRFEADWAYFQAALDAADITLLGRHTHEVAPNVKHRRRLVVSRGVRAVIQEDACTWWANPKEVTPASAVAVVSGSAAEVAVVGGTGVFGWILDEGDYETFHLSVAHQVRLGAGRPLFDDVDDLDAAIGKLEKKGLLTKQRSWLDQKAGLELLILGRSAI